MYATQCSVCEISLLPDYDKDGKIIGGEYPHYKQCFTCMCVICESCLEQYKSKIVLEGGKKVKQCISETCNQL